MAPLMPFFLDFDGTLHPIWTFKKDCRGRETAKPYTGPWLIEAPTLEAILAPYSDRIEIIISSWWAYTRSLEQIRALLPPALAIRVVDSIWLPELRAGSNDYRSHFATRYNCIGAWLKRRRSYYSGPWLALDDDGDSFPEDQREHLVLAWGTLANPVVQSNLAERLKKVLAP